MTFRNITAAVVGTGFIGPVHVEALRRLGVRVKGVVGSSPAKSKAAAEALGLEVGYANYEAVLNDPEVHVVHLASPNRVHAEQIHAAFKAGKHVVCEKPLGMTPAETAALIADAAARPNLIAAVNYNIRFYPLCLQARHLIQSGEVGEVFHIQGSYVQDWLLKPTDFNWRVLTSEGGALRAVGDIGTHWLDLIQFVTGLKIDAVFADLQTIHEERIAPPAGSRETFTNKVADGGTRVKIDTEDYATILLRFRGGRKGVMTVSQVTAGRKNCLRYEIAGSKKALAWDSEKPNELWIGAREQSNAVLTRDPSLLAEEVRPYANYPGGHNEGFPDSFKQLYRAIYADVAAGKRSAQPLYATFEDGHRELLLCDAILKSHQSGKWVEVGAQ